MTKYYHKVFLTLEKLKLEAQKAIETIRRNLYRTRPTIPDRHQLEEYIKRIESVTDIINSLDILVTKTFDAYIEFINIYWEMNEKFDSNEQHKILAEKYDMSLTEWQSLSNKIERFNETVKNSV